MKLQTDLSFIFPFIKSNLNLTIMELLLKISKVALILDLHGARHMWTLRTMNWQTFVLNLPVFLAF